MTLDVSDMMQPGHISLPNGAGLDYVTEDGQVVRKGSPPNELTDTRRRDFLAGTPWHKNVPAKLQKVAVRSERDIETENEVGAAK